MKIAEFSEAGRIASQALKANALRSFLTAMGIVIGIFFVVMMGWFLDGLDKSFDKTISFLGSDMLYADRWSWAGGGSWRDEEKRRPITMNEVERVQEILRGAELVMPHTSKWGANIKYAGNTLSGINIVGVPAEYSKTPAGNLTDGRFFSYAEDYHNVDVAVIGHKIAETMFSSQNPIDKVLQIKGRKFRIVGVVEKRGTFIADFVDNQIFIPIGSFIGMYGVSRRGVQIAIKAGSDKKLDEVREEARAALRQARGLTPNEPDDFTINESQMFRDQIQVFRLSIWGIGMGLTILSFGVGIIGITNIMFVSVTERTKEIGIRKALGAKRFSILLQFLLESCALCFSGAVIALVASSAVIFATVKFIPKVEFLTPYIPPQLLLIASAVAIVVGILAGLTPALRAARMNPVDALRYE